MFSSSVGRREAPLSLTTPLSALGRALRETMDLGTAKVTPEAAENRAEMGPAPLTWEAARPPASRQIVYI